MPLEETQNTQNAQQAINQRFDAIFSFINHGRFDSAFTRILHIDSRDLNNPDDLNKYYLAKGRCLYGLGMYDDAISAFMGIPGWQHSAKVLNALAYCYQKLGQQEIADSLFENETVHLLLDLGRELLDAGLFAKALRAFRAVPDWRNTSAAMKGAEEAFTGMGDHQRAAALRMKIEVKWPENRNLQAEYELKLTQPALFPRFFTDRSEMAANSSRTVEALDLSVSGPRSRR